MTYTYQLIRGKSSESYPEFSERVFALTQSILAMDGAARLKITITDSPPPAISVIPFKKEKIAAIRIGWQDAVPENPFTDSDGAAGSFIVEHALPVAYERNWPLGDRTPGVCLLTLFRKKDGISYETFIDRWHNGHTPLSLEIHPLWHYDRNVVKSNWKDQGFWYDGIVEEHCRHKNELLNPFIFFGKPLSIIPNMIRVYKDVRSFLDYGSVEPYFTSEYIIKEDSRPSS